MRQWYESGFDESLIPSVMLESMDELYQGSDEEKRKMAVEHAKFYLQI